jgi:DNA-binding NtrC family response regulator
MQRVYERLAIAARTRDPVLLVGESGTGKELAARAIHALSGDPAERFIAVNCAALPRDLMESELFGHTAGAFSGARGEHLGVFRAASGGTLFLDELTELVPEAQAKLLRALQERAVRPVGALAEVPVAVRIVASTNRDLRESLAEGRLRRDLYYRLQSLVVTIPPLRERREDIPLLVRHFLARAEEEGMRCCRFGASREVLRLLSLHDWPGNVRELENAIRFACRLDRGPRLEASDLPAEIVAAAKKAEARARALGCDLETPAAPMGETASKSPSPSAAAPERSLMTIREAEREAIARALRATGGNKARAARLLSISRKQLYAKIREYGLDPRADLVPKELGERGRDDTR